MEEDSNDPVHPDDELGDEADGLGTSLSGFARWTGGMLVALGLVLAAWYGPGWYLDERDRAFEACLSADPAERDAPPLSCLSHFGSAHWLSRVPWASSDFSEVHDAALADAHASQLRYFSTVEPSADKRAKTLDRTAELSDRIGPVDLAYSEPDISNADQYLSGIGEFVERHRTRQVSWSLHGPSEGLHFHRALRLAKFTGDTDLQGWLVDRGLEAFAGDAPVECVRCEEVFELAVMACRLGRREDAMRITDQYAQVDRTDHLSARPGWEDYGADRRNRIRENARERNEEATAYTRRLRRLCSPSEDATITVGDDGPEIDLLRWWETSAGREYIEDSVHLSRSLVQFTAVAHALSAGDLDGDALGNYLGEVSDMAPTTDLDRLMEQFATQYTSSISYPRPLYQFWSRNLLATPDVFEEAANRLAERFDLASRQQAAKLVRAMRMASAAAAMRTGQPDRALETLQTIGFPDEAPRYWFRSTLHRLAGHPAEAADLLGEALESTSGDLDARARLHLQHLTALGAAGDHEAARRAYTEVSTDRWRNLGQEAQLTRYAGLGYTLAFADETSGNPRETLRQIVPARLRPDALDELPDSHSKDTLRYAHNLLSAPPSERKSLRVDPETVGTDSVWYQAALGLSVDTPYDPEVFVDFVIGTGTASITASIDAWRRAEAARWRGDEEAAEVWTERLFAKRRHLDDTRSLLLEAMF
jgi:hypothetical protein